MGRYGHNWLAGLSGWQNLDHTLKEDPGSELQERLKIEWQTVDVQHLQLDDLLTTIFGVAHAPLDLDQLTKLIAGFWGIEDPNRTARTEIGEPGKGVIWTR